MKSQKTNSLSKRRTSNTDSFLEAFRDLGSDIVSTASDNFKGGLNDVKDALFPFGQSQTGENKQDFWKSQQELERKYQTQVRQAEVIHREEKVLFTREQKETQEQVKNLQEQIKGLAQATSQLSSQANAAEIVAMQETPNAGKYQLTFLKRLIKAIAELRAQVQESSFWLAAWNKKSQKKNYYWGQFKKSGSKFLLSSDRYMATQAG